MKDPVIYTSKPLYDWMNARHEIHLRRMAGQEWPWTEDKIFRTYSFTNVFRELDKTTVWFKENIRNPLKDQNDVIMAAVIFRWFNRISTGERLLEHPDLYGEWDTQDAIERLKPHAPWVTGSYIIKTPNIMDKLSGVCWCIDNMWTQRDSIIKHFREASPCIRDTVNYLKRFDFMGGFMAYEVASDLRWTWVLEGATDKLEYAHAGPGCKRGLNRLIDRHLGATITENKACELMRNVLADAPSYWKHNKEWPLEMREIEHSLCEYDKYERTRMGEGRPRGTYKRQK